MTFYSMARQLKNPEFKINPENCHPCNSQKKHFLLSNLLYTLWEYWCFFFLWKVNLKILNSGLILKTFTHAIHTKNIFIIQPAIYNVRVLMYFFLRSMESQLQNPEFRINPENFHPCNPHQKHFITQPAIYRCIFAMVISRCLLTLL